MTAWPLVAAVPWLLAPIVMLRRLRDSPSLDDEAAAPPDDAPLVSVIIPARDEALDIERCVRSVLASTYPALEVIVIDDHSADDTPRIVGAIAAEDARVRLLHSAPLAAGWFGKQWACVQGVHAASGSLYCFTDADTVHGPQLLARAVNALRARPADFLSVAGRQVMATFWERMVQPVVFSVLLARFGGPGHVNRARRASAKIANGQFMLITRTGYFAVNGHMAVRAKVAEDLALAQLFFRRGLRTELTWGLDHLSTRMYRSLGDLVQGWRKNVYAGGLDAAPFGRAGRALLPVMLVSVPVLLLAPVVTLLAALAWPLSDGVVAWAAVCTVITLLWFAAGSVMARASPFWALGFPLGTAVFAWIVLRALASGRRVEWKGREYRAG